MKCESKIFVGILSILRKPITLCRRKWRILLITNSLLRNDSTANTIYNIIISIVHPKFDIQIKLMHFLSI